VLCYRTVVANEWWDQLSKPDLGRPYYRDALELLRPLGWYSYQHLFGMMTHRHMTEFGTTETQLAEIILAARRHAQRADNALRTDDLSLQDYLGSPFTVQPLREIDDVVWANGGCAVIVTSADHAADAPNGAAYLIAAAQSTGIPPQHSFEFWPARVDMHSSLTRITTSLWNHGVAPADVQTLQCYDTTPISVVLALEGLGFCPVGEAGPFIESGGIATPGTLEVCTNGGHTSAAYLHGFSQVIEAVRRVRPRPSEQPADRFAVISGAPTTPTSAAILATEPL
jgi:acetyl-CoA acetyltransferase